MHINPSTWEVDFCVCIFNLNLIISHIWVFCLNVYMYYMHAVTYGDQKRAGDPPELELQMVARYHVGCWKLNSGPMEEQQGFSTAELVLQPLILFLRHGIT